MLKKMKKLLFLKIFYVFAQICMEWKALKYYIFHAISSIDNLSEQQNFYILLIIGYGTN